MNKDTHAPWVRRAFAAALLVCCGSARTSAQPPVGVGSLAVSIVSPASGSAVAGTITVSASLGPLGLLPAGVQFKLDGSNLGTEDTTAPYAVPWSTTTASNGPHTLTAVLRDTTGLEFVSDPVTVTVSNSPPDTTPPTVRITSPASGSTLAGTITLSATASDNVGVAGVQFQLDGAGLGAEQTTAPYAVSWDTTTASDGSHTLTATARDAAGNRGTSAPVTVIVSNAPGFATGDLFVSIVNGPVQWRHADGTLNADLAGTVPGPSEGLRFDGSGNLYVNHWCADSSCTTGNTVEEFNSHGVSQGAVGSGYNCNPHDIAFDASGRAYVGLADCSGDILRFAAGGPPTAYAVAAENRGAFWIDLAADGCTIFYTSEGPSVKRFDLCANAQLPDFNRAPLPGGQTQALRVLPDGGVLVSSGQVIARLDGTGALVRTYSVSSEGQLWAGLDVLSDGTFWAANYASSNIYKFDLATGAMLASFNSGTPTSTVVAIIAKP